MSRGHREGFSLMEVILAMSILLGGILVLGRLAFIGSRHARHAEDLATAQLLCEARMNEILTGLALSETSDEERLLNAPDWVVSSELLPLEQPGVSAVQVTVTLKPETLESLTTTSARPEKDLSFTLIRWVADPLGAGGNGGTAGGVESVSSTGGVSP